MSAPPVETRQRLVAVRTYTVLACAVAATHLYFNGFGVISELHFGALHFALFAVLAAAERWSYGVGRGWWHLLLAVGAVASVIWLWVAEDALYARGTAFNLADWVFATLAVCVALVWVWMRQGAFIPILVLVFVTYATFWGAWVPGVFHFPGLNLETMLFRSYFGGDGLFGPIANISARYVFSFILFGAFLLRSGAGDFLIDLSKAVAGRMVGGAGLVAVLGSGLMGSVSGSAVANTAATGVISIPMMRRAGFQPRFAAAVEAAASTGGQLMPPVMGAGAFVMASYTQVSYGEIVVAAALPALLYFLSVGFYVRIEARRLGLAPEVDAEPVGEVLRRGWPLLLPLGALVALLAAGFSPAYAAAGGVVAAVAASWLTPQPMGPRATVEALVDGCRGMTSTALLLVAIGLVVNTVTTTGMGNTFSLMISDWAGGELWVAVLLIAAASLVLGAGLPVTAAYVVLATLSAPLLAELLASRQLVLELTQVPIAADWAAVLALVEPGLLERTGELLGRVEAERILDAAPQELLVLLREQLLSPATLTANLLAAHFVIFWLSQDSNVTPPVCLSAYTAAAIAGTRPLQTGLTAWMIAKGLYLIPLLFVYTPLLSGDWTTRLVVFGFACFGLYALALALQGYAAATLSWWRRSAYFAVGVLLLLPVAPVAVRSAVLAGFLLLLWGLRRKLKGAASPSAGAI